MPDLNKHKIYWHSRRGMLELDLLLMPFAKDVFETLSPQDQLLYSELLEQEDQDLFGWLMERNQPEQEHLRPIIARILEHNKNSS